MTIKTELTQAELKWQDSTPVSSKYDDFYFSTDDGINESRYVYLKANRLPERFIEEDLTNPFIVAESGFGAGLNFLLTWKAWKALKQTKRPLHFFSIEKYPLSKDDLLNALSNWPELEEFVTPLIEQYPALIPGMQCLEFEQGNVKLNLLFGDVCQDLKNATFKADAWFLDGFSPKKNPDMWSRQFFKLIKQRSHAKTSFSTFTSASLVRNRLIESGFQVTKQEGFGKKREMLFGEFMAHELPANTDKPQTGLPLWYYPSSYSDTHEQLINNTNTQAYDAVIIGAGLSGLSTAHELAQQGLNVAIIEAQSGPAEEASGQSQLAMYAKLPTEANKLFRFTIQTLAQSFRFYQCFQNEEAKSSPEQSRENKFWHSSGLLQLAWSDKELSKQTSFLNNINLPETMIKGVDAALASQLSGLDIHVPALWFPQSGWLDPKKYAYAILKNPKIDVLFNTRVKSFDYDARSKLWAIKTSKGSASIEARNLIVANANSAKSFPHFAHLPTKPLRGQVTSINAAELKPSKTVLCGEGYLCPPVNGWHHFGATFDLKEQQSTIKKTDTLKNIVSIRTWLPDWLNDKQLAESDIENSAGLRCTTPDYLPIVGRAPVADKMISNFAKLREDSNACQHQYGEYFPQLFVNIGHGSKGVITTPLAAKIIRHQICGGLPPCLDEHLLMLSPSRFLIKHLTQRRI